MMICKNYANVSMMDYARTITEALALRDCLNDISRAMLVRGLTSAASDYEIDAFLFDNLANHAERNNCPPFSYCDEDIELIRTWIRYHEEN